MINLLNYITRLRFTGNFKIVDGVVIVRIDFDTTHTFTPEEIVASIQRERIIHDITGIDKLRYSNPRNILTWKDENGRYVLVR